MNIYHQNIDVNLVHPVVTIGMFDGVHSGHRKILESVISIAKKQEADSLVITFDPHPRIVLSERNPGLKFLTSLDEKINLLEEVGIENLLILPFTKEVSRISASDFVKMLLVDKINISHLVMGFDHHIGHQGLGDFDTVSGYAQEFGFSVSRVTELKDKNSAINSSTIRNCLITNNLAEANRLLGYNYFLRGRVVRGMRIGSKMGYPTANIQPEYQYKLIPSAGVYAVEVAIENSSYKGMLYIGSRPTLEGWGGEMTIEVNIFDFQEDLYDRDLTIFFSHWLREDIRFDNAELLYEQIKRDKKDALRLLGE